MTLHATRSIRLLRAALGKPSAECENENATSRINIPQHSPSACRSGRQVVDRPKNRQSSDNFALALFRICSYMSMERASCVMKPFAAPELEPEDLGAKGLGAKDLEAKDFEAKNFETKHLEAKNLEAKDFETKHLEPHRSRAEVVEDLRRSLPRLEGACSRRLAGERLADERPAFRFGLAGLDAHLPRGGLAAGALHEVVPEGEADMPAAFAFVAALLGRMPQEAQETQEAPLLLVSSPRGLADCGRPHGHGLAELGLDPARLILVEAEDEPQALWAVEEALRSGVPAAVAGAIGRDLDLKTSRRLHLAAGSSGLPLFLLRPAGMTGSSAAATRWRIGSASGARDRFGLLAGWRWRLRLERCRNGRLGEWLVEWDHAAYRFSLAAEMAAPALPRGAGARAGQGSPR
jgi:protein ImuA